MHIHLETTPLLTVNSFLFTDLESALMDSMLSAVVLIHGLIHCIFFLYGIILDNGYFISPWLLFLTLLGVCQLGIRAWNTVHDNTGCTPEDYACSRGHGSYIQLVQRKISDKSDKGHVVLHINGNDDTTYKQADGPCSGKLSGFEIEKSKISPAPPPYCKRCSQQLAYSRSMSSSLLYRPAMLAMVGIAAVCVCVALLFKGPPEVLLVYPPFRWELLDYGFIWVRSIVHLQENAAILMMDRVSAAAFMVCMTGFFLWETY